MPSITDQLKKLTTVGRQAFQTLGDVLGELHSRIYNLPIAGKLRGMLPERVQVGLVRPGGVLEPSLLATVATAIPKGIAEATGGAIRLPGAKAAGTVEAAGQLVSTAGLGEILGAPSILEMARGMSTKTTPTPAAQISKTEETAPATLTKSLTPPPTERTAPAITETRATLPERVTPTRVAERREAPTATGAGIPIPPPPSPIGAPGPAPAPAGIGGAIPPPAAPASVIQREQVRIPVSDVIRQILEAQRAGAERPGLVELPLPEAIEERAKPPRRLEEIIAQLLGY